MAGHYIVLGSEGACSRVESLSSSRAAQRHLVLLSVPVKADSRATEREFMGWMVSGRAECGQILFFLLGELDPLSGLLKVLGDVLDYVVSVEFGVGLELV